MGEKSNKFRWSNLTYTTRVTLSFALIAAMTVLVAIGVVSFVWEQYFQTYTTENMRSLASITAERISSLYDPEEGLENSDVTMPAVQAAEMTSGVAIKVVSATGDTVYDSSAILTGSVDDGANSISFEPKDSSQVAFANIVYEDTVVGSVRIWVYGSDTLMRQPDQEFRDHSYQALLLAAIVAIVLASCLGYIFARNLAAPINRIMLTARSIKEGDLGARTDLTGEDEVARLGEMFA
ncbi:MAG: HAMP domain-containing protein, partial [Eggerthellaceae bacterium]|nr:HAMP domain-containing protein [Eggerthellaceae bacterium]